MPVGPSVGAPPGFLADLLDSLDDEQRAAALLPDGPAQIIAPAGSGKTATLVARIGVMLARGVPAARILVVTFNRDAAAELSRRIESRLELRVGATGPEVRTLHALGRQVLLDAGVQVRLVADRLPLLRHARRSVLARLGADASLPPAEELDGVVSTAILEARNVVVAAGQYQKPKVPGLGSELPEHVFQIHSSEYRNPRELPPGAVLVVGTGQSGAQIAEEIYQSGRRVFLVVSRCGRGPRRYRGKDTSRWMFEMGMFDQTVDKLPPDAKSRCNMHVSGRDGGHDLNLRAFARDGVVLLGRLEGAADGRIFLAADLRENLANADQSAAKLKKSIDEFIRKMAIDAPEDDAANDFGPNEGAEGEPLLELDLATKDIASVVWATGYRREFGWIHLPITGEDGDPIHRRGVSPFPGLFFLGLRLLHKPKSELLLGVGEDAMFPTSQIRSRDRRRTTDGEP